MSDFRLFILIFSFLPGALSQEFEVEKTSFSCQGRVPGYYADVQTGCKTYHVCDGNSQFTYVCPPRTLFQPRARICDHAYLVECEESAEDYVSAENALYDEYDDVSNGTTNYVDYGRSPTTQQIVLPQSKTLRATTTTTSTTEQPVTFGLATTTTTTTSTTTSWISRTTGQTATLLTEFQKNGTDSTRPTTPSPPDPTPATEQLKSPLRLKLNDFRHLFFIPEVDNSTEVATKRPKELILPVQVNLLMKFGNRKSDQEEPRIPCPSYCNPRFLVAGTCHPCVTIK